MSRPPKRARRALSGMIISSEPSSETLKTKAEYLGATYLPELTSKTTHFLTETAGTESHRRALTQKTLILRTGWLHQCHSAKMDVPAKTYFLPPLSGLTICCSGLDAQEKAGIESLCRDTGAQYSRTLGRNCTHLLCDTPTGRKYEFAKSSGGIMIVRSRWLRECAAGNVLLDEAGYLLPVGRDGVCGSATATGTGTEIVGASAVAGTQPSQLTQPQSVREPRNSILDGAVLYLPPSTVADRVKHAPLHTRALRLAARSGATVSMTLSSLVTHVIILRSPSASTLRALKACDAVVTTLEWLEDVCESGRLVKAYEYKTLEQVVKKERPRQESSTFLGVRAQVGPLARRDTAVASGVESVLVSGRGKALPYDNSGRCVSGVPTHIVFPADMRAADVEVLQDARAENGCVVGVTAFWVEMCNAAEQLLPTSWCMLFRPLGYAVPVEGMVGMGVTISGFQKSHLSNWDCRREVLRRVAILLGCRYSERMRRRGTRVLIAEKDGSDKVRKAREWGIEVVGVGWLHECVSKGKFVEFADWRLGEDGDDGAVELLEKFTDGIEASGKVVQEIRRVRSRSVSRDDWSMDASQSQLIVHRDLTPPATPS